MNPTKIRCVADLSATKPLHVSGNLGIIGPMADMPSSTPKQPAWAKLLQEQRQSRGYSARKAAMLAGLSDSFWGMAERGYKPVRGKAPRPMLPSRRTLIQMTEALRLSPASTNAILTAAGYKPVPVSGEQPDPRADVDLRGLTTGDIVLLNAISGQLRDARRSGAQYSKRGESSLHPRTASLGETVE